MTGCWNLAECAAARAQNPAEANLLDRFGLAVLTMCASDAAEYKRDREMAGVRLAGADARGKSGISYRSLRNGLNAQSWEREYS